MKSLKLSLLAFAISMLMAGNVVADCYTTDWFSEEPPAQASCNDGYAVKEVRCKGSYCDDKQLYCCSDNLPEIYPNTHSESPYFSEEQRPYVGYGRIVVGMSCTGKYCDNVSLKMMNVKNEVNNYEWGPWFSEEEGKGTCSGNGYVAGLDCNGRYCDDLSLFCVTWKDQ